jgi:uncharacterized DUF497 family protein
LKLLTSNTKKYYFFYMPTVKIEWDAEKARTNFEKHKVRFQVAQYVFDDPGRLERLDQSESDSGEERWQVLSKVEEVLLVVFQEKNSARRLISARLATKAEKRAYNGYYHIDGKGWTRAE